MGMSHNSQHALINNVSLLTTPPDGVGKVRLSRNKPISLINGIGVVNKKSSSVATGRSNGLAKGYNDYNIVRASTTVF